ncbi:MAG: hypothetical protein V7603_3156 [Micromonosporaceae bacterium]
MPCLAESGTSICFRDPDGPVHLLRADAEP